MKKTIIAAVMSLALFGCTDTKKQEKDLLDKVIAVHDKVMAKDEQLMKNKASLDTLAKAKQDTAAATLVKQLDAADEAMEDWMHKFDAENKGKSHDEVMSYLEDQHKKITAIDQNFDSAIKVSDDHIRSAKKQ